MIHDATQKITYNGRFATPLIFRLLEGRWHQQPNSEMNDYAMLASIIGPRLHVNAT